MPPAIEPPAQRARSAEQTARLLLSTGFRYDSWEAKETRKSIQAHGGVCTTIQLAFRDLATQQLADVEVDALNLVLFDPSHRMFYGSSYQLDRHGVTRPLVLQAAPKQLLVLETLVQQRRPSSGKDPFRVTGWATVPVANLANGPVSFNLHRGTAQLLQVEPGAWPASVTRAASDAASIVCDVAVNADAALAKLMDELVPPGVIIEEDFTRGTPSARSATFRLSVTSIELAGTSTESSASLADPDADWSVAAIAHNGLRALGSGSEVPLTRVRGPRHDQPGSTTSSVTSSVASAPPPAAGAAVLRSDISLEMDRLPVHSATSLVVAVRRRAPGARSASVVGFCVVPLCVMPMQDRDIRVENLPALRGPFSCEDARLLMLDSTSPYGRVPMAVTLTVQYHDTGVSAEVAAAEAQKETMAVAPAGEAVLAAGTAFPSAVIPGLTVAPTSIAEGAASQQLSHSQLQSSSQSRQLLLASSSSSVLTGSGASMHALAGPSGFGVATQAVGLTSPILSTTDAPAVPQPPLMQLTSPLRGAPPVSSFGAEGMMQGDGERIRPAPGSTAMTVPGVSSADEAGVFKLLCMIMEELHKVRVTQDAIMRQTNAFMGGGGSDRTAMSPALMGRVNDGLADTAVDVVDLAPRRVAVSWRARMLMREGVQPLLHPVEGSILDDSAPLPTSASAAIAASLCGFRVEGVTLDKAITMPADLCLLFSFGTLPLQQAGPLRTSVVEENEANASYKIFDAEDRSGAVWCEPIEDVQSAAMRKFKNIGNATVFVHLYDALTMFYVATAPIPLEAFRRPLSAACAIAPMDAVLQRDLCMTEEVVPPKVYPIMRQAGQVHMTLFCVAAGMQACAGTESTPPEGMRVGSSASSSTHVITAKKLRHADQLDLSGSATSSAGASRSPDRATPVVESPHSPPDVAVPDCKNGEGLHWQRAAYVKAQLRSQQQSTGPTQAPGVPAAHLQAAQDSAELEYRLRQLEHERTAIKSRRIAEALLRRLTVKHDVHVLSWRPETVRSPFTNPFSVAARFVVEVDAGDTALCSVTEEASLALGPRERAEVALVLRLATADSGNTTTVQDVTARIYTESRELVNVIYIHASVLPPVVHRRYEVFGAAGSEVVKRFVSRPFSAASFPANWSQSALLDRMRDLCAYAATSSGATSVMTSAVADPITQSYVMAWEEVTVTTTVPSEIGRQRVEYVTFFHDAAMTRVYETWELCVFACECSTTRDIDWGQTTALGLPAEGTEAMYCSDASATVEARGPSYILRLHPSHVGTQRMLLHTLVDGSLKKTLLTVPTVYPTPTFAQVVELSLAEAAGPVLRRLTFIHRGEREEVFQVHHNYRFNLRITPSRFALAPGDSQFVSLQFDMLALPPGQLEGRCPMWIFINNAEDKTVESYHLEVVLRAHPVVPTA